MTLRTTLIAAAIATLGASAWAQGATTAPATQPAAAARATAPAPAALKKDHAKDTRKMSQKKDKSHKLKLATHKPAAQGSGTAAAKPAAQ